MTVVGIVCPKVFSQCGGSVGCRQGAVVGAFVKYGVGLLHHKLGFGVGVSVHRRLDGKGAWLGEGVGCQVGSGIHHDIVDVSIRPRPS